VASFSGRRNDRVRGQAWTLSATGTWNEFQLDANGDGDYSDTGTEEVDQNRAHNVVNEITGVTEEYQNQPAWADPAYSARGNMTTVPKPTALTSTFASKYDAWNRLALVYVDVNTNGDYDAGTDTLMAKYEYDGRNRRVKAHIDAQAPAEPNGVDHYRHFYYNASWQILETRKSTSEETGPETLDVEMQYVWSARYIDAPVLRDRDADDDAETGDLGVTDSGLEERLYYTNDANMNVTALLATDGTPLERYVYDPYGKVTIYDDDWSDTRQESAYDNSILFAGYYRDNETGLYHVRNRYYHPYFGWLTRDPAGYMDGMSLYEYVGGNPLGAFDPSGCGWLSDAGNRIKDAATATLDFVGGATIGYLDTVLPVKEVAHEFGFELRNPESEAEARGRELGRDIGIVQATAEVIAGGLAVVEGISLMAGGGVLGGVGVAGAPATGGGSLVLEGVAVPAVAVGAVETAAGVGVAGHGLWVLYRAQATGGPKTGKECPRLPAEGTPERSAIEAARRQGIEAKKAQELAEIQAGGRGSGAWTEAELKQIRETGKFPPDTRWHHDPTVANRPDLAADPRSVRPVRGGTEGHLGEHGGDWRKPSE